MQGEEKRPASSGRPSLLSTEPPAVADRASILDGLERRPATASAAGAVAAGRKKALLAGGAAVIALVAVGVAALLNFQPEPGLTLPAVPVATAPQPAPPAPAAAVAAVPAATIVEETAAVSPPADNTRSLKEMLNDTPTKQPKDELTAALEKPHAAPAKPKLAEHKKADKPVRKPVQVAKKAETKPKAQPDSDVALLAALMAHVQSGKPAKETATPASQLKQCSRMSEAGAAQCREHLCATTARKEPECKSQPVAVKTAAES
ncbi:hypothetical protein GTP45_08685 [Pseudoduganella sp. FT55W]|uniref:Uncharacterized protein n=1 Tax=Duganella rivi TaxID=2666083 RepID=A0A7X4GPL2_9BURK|nr:hypothetical protein [Duganella rivi]MYM66904.1 hypothetical protein [Duganella rivi]